MNTWPAGKHGVWSHLANLINITLTCQVLMIMSSVKRNRDKIKSDKPSPTEDLIWLHKPQTWWTLQSLIWVQFGMKMYSMKG